MAVANIILFLLVVLAKSILGSNILYIAPIASPSHHIWNKALGMGLVERGHNLTMISHDTEKLPLHKNFTLITMEGLYDVIHDVLDMEQLAEETVLESIVSLYDVMRWGCEYDYNTTGLETLLNYPKVYKFDLIIYDATIGRCLYPLIERFHNPPTIAVTPFLLPPVLASVFGQHLYTSYMPYHSTKYTNRMSIVERLFNFIFTYEEVLYRNYIFLPKENALISEKFRGHSLSVDELERSISLLLCNTDPILAYPQALPPNIIPVGGLHARPPKALPKDLQKITDNAKDGVILFSLGTNVRSDTLNSLTRRALLDAFAKLPQIVLWKFESDILEGLPKNVFIRKWLPQNDILGHPNTRLFISHGGALSTQEAMYHGIPVIGIPFFADQHVNIRKMEDRKIAKFLDRQKLTYSNIYGTIKEVLDSSIYIENMRTISRLYHDQPQTALERAVYWVEYVLRHGTAEHLVSVSRDVPVYQSSNVDVLSILVLGLVLAYSVLVFTISLCRFIFTLRSSVRTKTTN